MDLPPAAGDATYPTGQDTLVGKINSPFEPLSLYPVEDSVVSSVIPKLIELCRWQIVASAPRPPADEDGRWMRVVAGGDS